jgi:hypothetical protein
LHSQYGGGLCPSAPNVHYWKAWPGSNRFIWPEHYFCVGVKLIPGSLNTNLFQGIQTDKCHVLHYHFFEISGDLMSSGNMEKVITIN